MAIVINGTSGITGVPAIGSAASNTAVTMNDSGSNSNTCRAWVNFNGTGTVAIRASFNVTSITDNGTGDYTVNFTTAMPDGNYAVVTGASANSDPAGGAGFNMTTRSPSTNTTTSTRLLGGVSNTSYDIYVCHVAIFR